jgi:hypothetical protein
MILDDDELATLEYEEDILSEQRQDCTDWREECFHHLISSISFTFRRPIIVLLFLIGSINQSAYGLRFLKFSYYLEPHFIAPLALSPRYGIAPTAISNARFLAPLVDETPFKTRIRRTQI